MPATILPFSSRRLIDRRKKVVGRHLPFRELTDARHVPRTRPSAPGFPIIPNLPDRSDGSSAGVESERIAQTPLAQGVGVLTSNHTIECKLLPYPLTSGGKGFSGSIMSADILQFARMENAPNRIRELRLRAGLSQQALGDLIAVSKMTISDLERGKMEFTQSYMKRIANALAVSPADLLSESDNPDRLSDDERMLIEQFRNASSAQRELIRRIAEPVDKQKNVA